LKELKKHGYTVIPNVLAYAECDRHIAEYRAWIQQFKDKGFSWHNGNSLVQSYRTAHFQASWKVRLEVKDVFAQIWSSEKLLTSADAVAISEPPETGDVLLFKSLLINNEHHTFCKSLKRK